MAFACQCDRCGKFMKPACRVVKRVYIAEFSYVSNTHKTNTKDSYDICDDCCKALRDWMKVDEQEETKNE